MKSIMYTLLMTILWILNGIIDVGIGSIITLLIMFNKEQRTRFLKKVLKRK